MSKDRFRCDKCGHPEGMTLWDGKLIYTPHGCPRTASTEARAGVGCAGLVGASDAESEEPEGWCNPCGTLRGHKCWGHCIGTRIVGTNDMERIAPTEQGHLSQPGASDAATERIESNGN